jgi:hypothetical protein
MNTPLDEDDVIHNLGVGPSHLDSSNVSTSSSSFQTNGVRNRLTNSIYSQLEENSSELLKMRRHSRGRSEDEMLPVLEPFDLEKYPIRELQFRIPGLVDPIVINPMVTLVAVALLWGVVIYTIGTFEVFPNGRYATLALVCSHVFMISFCGSLDSFSGPGELSG